MLPVENKEGIEFLESAGLKKRRKVNKNAFRQKQQLEPTVYLFIREWLLWLIIE